MEGRLSVLATLLCPDFAQITESGTLNELSHSEIEVDTMVNQRIANTSGAPEKIRPFKKIAAKGVFVAIELCLALGGLVQCWRRLDQRHLALF